MSFPRILAAHVVALMVLAAVVLAWPAKAQEIRCDNYLNPVVVALMAQNIPHKVLDAREKDMFVRHLEARLGIRLLPDVSRVLIAQFATGTVYGLEINGCLSRPVLIAPAKPKAKANA